MKKIILTLLILFSFQINIFSQINAKSEKEILKSIEWISTHPVLKSDKKFVSKTADYIMFQIVNYPNFPVNFKALFEFMNSEKKYKYYDEINIVFTSNQLANKIKTDKKYNLTNSSIISLKKVLKYYKLVLEEEPLEKNSILDKYLTMTEIELEDHVKEILSN